MTSPDDFHLISWRNFFTLGAIAVGVLIPVGLRYWFRTKVEDIEDQTGLITEPVEAYIDDPEDRILAVGPPGLGLAKKAGERLLLRRDDDGRDDSDDDLESFYDDVDEDEDIILEAGPRIPSKGSYRNEPLLVDVGSSSSESVINLSLGAHPLATGGRR
jgi:hypothetical protein